MENVAVEGCMLMIHFKTKIMGEGGGRELVVQGHY